MYSSTDAITCLQYNDIVVEFSLLDATTDYYDLGRGNDIFGFHWIGGVQSSCSSREL
jgi:hypothetical protein